MISNTWLDHPGKVALVGSVIILVGQLGATIFPILFGPDLSDYNLLCSPAYHEIVFAPPLLVEHNKIVPNGENGLYFKNTSTYCITEYEINNSVGYCYCILTSVISIINLHPIHKYNRQVSLDVTCPPGFSATLQDPVINGDGITHLTIKANLTYLISNNTQMFNTSYNNEGSPISLKNPIKYQIAIQGNGADGKKRISTIIIKLENPLKVPPTLRKDGIPQIWIYTINPKTPNKTLMRSDEPRTFAWERRGNGTHVWDSWEIP